MINIKIILLLICFLIILIYCLKPCECPRECKVIEKINLIVISMKKSTDRRENLKKVLKDYNYEIFDGIDGKILTKEDKDQYFLSDSNLKIGEYGCFLSHVAVLRIIAERNEPYLVLEDDIKELPPNILKTPIPTDADLLYFGHLWYHQKRGCHIYGNIYKSVFPLGLWAILITPAGAKKILNFIDNNKVSKPIDVIYLDLFRDDCILNSYSYWPPLKTNNSLSTTVQTPIYYNTN